MRNFTLTLQPTENDSTASGWGAADQGSKTENARHRKSFLSILHGEGQERLAAQFGIKPISDKTWGQTANAVIRVTDCCDDSWRWRASGEVPARDVEANPVARKLFFWLEDRLNLHELPAEAPFNAQMTVGDGMVERGRDLHDAVVLRVKCQCAAHAAIGTDCFCL